MKKRLLTLSLTALMALCVVGGVACGGRTGNGGNTGSGNFGTNASSSIDSSSDSSSVVEREKEVVFADFETWETGMQLIRTGKYFGTISENKDARYVKSGEKSAIIRPLGGFRSSSIPIFFFPTQSEYFDFDHSDFSDADKVTFEFYYDATYEPPVDEESSEESTETVALEDKTLKVAVGLVTEINGLDNYQRTAVEYQLLYNGWNTIEYVVDVSALSINADVKSIKGIYVAFESVGSREVEDAPIVYLDDVVLHRKDEAPEIQDLVQLGENEYADFESEWQKHVISARNTAYAPDINIVNADDYKVGVPPAEGEEDTRPTLKSMEGSKVSGDKVMRLYAKNGATPNLNYPGMQFAPAMLQRSMFGSLAEEDYGRVTFAFDIYNNSDSRLYWGVSFYNVTSKQRMEYGIYVEPYQWTSFSVLIKDLYDDFRAKNKDSTSLFTEPGSLAIYWPEFTDGDKEFFLDNFRYEVEERDEDAAPTIHMPPFVRVAKVGDRLELPIATATDPYDLSVETKLSVYKKVSDEWQPLELESGLIPIDSVGDYKLKATAKNKLNNETTVEYLFKGVKEIEDNLWISYDYEDEKSNILLKGDEADNNKTEWLQSVTLGGETHDGVIKATTTNVNAYGAGYFGFFISKQRLDDATDANWDYFTISVYIDAPLSTLNFYSFNKQLLENVPTGCWTELRITKKQLMQPQTRINTSKSSVSETIFYESFNTICGTTEKVGESQQVLFTTNIKGSVSNGTITYYIDKITWGCYDETIYKEGDDYAYDIYDTQWADPWRKQEEL